MSDARTSVGEAGDQRRATWRRGLDWLVAVSPALVWFLHLNVVYLLVPPSCRVGHPWFMVAASVGAVVGAAGGTWASWRRAHGDDPSSRFAGRVGVPLGALSLLIIVGLGLASVIGDPCT